MTTTTPAPAIVPSFDDDEQTGRRLAIICSKGNLDMAYPGLVLANAALGEGVHCRATKPQGSKTSPSSPPEG